MQSVSSNHADPINDNAAVADGHVSPSASQARKASTSHENERKGSTSSGKGLDTHDSRSTNDGKPSEFKPIGIINEQNTCFLNSTFQAVGLYSIRLVRGGTDNRS
jgi:ubiquitin C-terminal hydrolase